MVAWSSGAIPIPVSLTAMVMTPSAVVAVRPTLPPSGGELHGVRQEVHQDLLHLPLVRDDVADLRVDMLSERDPVPGCPLPDQGQGIVEGGRQVEPLELQLQPAGLHLGQVEDVVDQGEQMPARGQDVLEVFMTS
jgi:hypothetical protein